MSFGVIHLGLVSDADVLTFNHLRWCINCFSDVCVFERPRSRVLLSCKRWSLLLVALFLAACGRNDDIFHFVSIFFYSEQHVRSSISFIVFSHVGYVRGIGGLRVLRCCRICVFS